MAPKTINDLAPLALHDPAEYRRQRELYFPDPPPETPESIQLRAAEEKARWAEIRINRRLSRGPQSHAPAPIAPVSGFNRSYEIRRVLPPEATTVVMRPEFIVRVTCDQEPQRNTWRAKIFNCLTSLDRAIYSIARLVYQGESMEGLTGSKHMKRGDKIAGASLIVGAVAALGAGLYFLLPILITLAENMIIFAIELVVVVWLGIILLDKNTWINMYYKWQNISRNIRKAIIKEDPIGVLDTVIKRFFGKLEDINEGRVQADAALKRQRRSRDESLARAATELDLALAAKRLGKPESQVGLHATNASRWEDMAGKMTPTIDLLERIKEGMARAAELCGVKLEDYKNQRDVKKVELESILAAQSGVKMFKRFFGNNADLEMQELALEEIDRQATLGMAEVDQFMEAVTPLLQTQDLRREAELGRAMERLEYYASTGEALPPAKPVITITKPIAIPATTERK